MSSNAMTISAAIDHFARAEKGMPSREWRLFIKVLQPGTVGGTPCVPVSAMTMGFDWDAGKIMLESDAQLTRLTAEDVAAIYESARKGQSWHAFKAWEKQEAIIKELKAEVARLKGGAA